MLSVCQAALLRRGFQHAGEFHSDELLHLFKRMKLRLLGSYAVHVTV